jgi:putative transposase
MRSGPGNSYVELNPVRAGLAQEAKDWPWSSAAAHVAGVDRTGILEMAEWERHWTTRTWRDALEQGVEDAALLERIREATRTGRPLAEPLPALPVKAGDRQHWTGPRP